MICLVNISDISSIRVVVSVAEQNSDNKIALIILKFNSQCRFLKYKLKFYIFITFDSGMFITLLIRIQLQVFRKPCRNLCGPNFLER